MEKRKATAEKDLINKEAVCAEGMSQWDLKHAITCRGQTTAQQQGGQLFPKPVVLNLECLFACLHKETPLNIKKKKIFRKYTVTKSY